MVLQSIRAHPVSKPIEAAHAAFIKAVCLGLLVNAVALMHVGDAAETQQGPTHFACVFDQGNSWTLEAGKFKSVAPAPLSFEVGDIDLEKQAATLILDGKKSGPLRIVRALDANHFLEVANEGFLNLTTIYDRDPTAGWYPAVHSRHFGVLGQPVFAQYAGQCTDKP